PCRGLRHLSDRREVDRRPLAQGAAIDADERRAKAFDAGIILVAARLVDRALAAELGLQWLDRDAVRLHRTIAATFTDRRIDHHAARRIFHGATLAAAPFL